MHTTINMTPNHHFILKSLPMEPVSRTYQYRKIVKPILERKRRGRINKCLDELKDLMTGTLQADGENISKLEKADILELTVRHLQRLREKDALFVKHNDTLHMEKFWSGFQHCASEVAQFLNKYDRNITTDLIQYIANYVPNVTTQSPAPITIALQQSLNMTNIIMGDTTTAAYCQRLGGSKNNSIPTLTTITTNSRCNHKEIKTLGTYPKMTVPLHTKKGMELEKEDNNVWRPW